VLISTAQSLPVGACVCSANHQDASFTAAALDSLVIDLPDQHTQADSAAEPGERGDGKRSRRQLQALAQQLWHDEPDVRSLPYLRADGNFRTPACLQAKQQGFRLWSPRQGQSRSGLGRIRSSVERTGALLNQFGRIMRRWDRRQKRYLAWIHLACCIIYMRQGFFP
jgi:hypothetical protein